MNSKQTKTSVLFEIGIAGNLTATASPQPHAPWGRTARHLPCGGERPRWRHDSRSCLHTPGTLQDNLRVWTWLLGARSLGVHQNEHTSEAPVVGNVDRHSIGSPCPCERTVPRRPHQFAGQAEPSASSADIAGHRHRSRTGKGFTFCVTAEHFRTSSGPEDRSKSHQTAREDLEHRI